MATSTGRRTQTYSHSHSNLQNPENPEPKTQTNEEERPHTPKSNHQQRLCDFCNQSKALLYCRADSAKLCFTCDHEVHSTNPLFTKHSRSQLCDSCDSKPASIHCCTENLVLCQNCDWDLHGSGGGGGGGGRGLSLSVTSSIHDRRPIEGFTGCPSATELCSIFGFKDVGDKTLLCNGKDGGLLESGGWDLNVDGDWLEDLLVWETNPIASLDDLIFSNDSRQDFQAMGVPTLPKNRDAACGKYKEAILCQLREMSKLETKLTTDHEEVGSLLGFQPLEQNQNHQPGSMSAGFQHDAEPVGFPMHEETGSKWKCNSGEGAVMIPVPSPFSSRFAEESLVPDKATDAGGSGQDANGDHENRLQHPPMRETHPFLSKFAPNELISHNRDSSISRYKEKKKTRRYDKHIRYETRKARAESRTRIKGRFAKVVDHQNPEFSSRP